MAKKKKSGLDKTLVEKILDKKKISYEQLSIDVAYHGDVADIVTKKEDVVANKIYKTIALMGNKTGPVVAVVPLDHTVSYKKLAQASGNKKVGMIPLKDLVATTGYEHGANTPVGIHETHPKFPIFIDQQAQKDEVITVSAGVIGRSVKLKADDLAKVVQATFADIAEPKD